jgi:hypothetical protein
MDEFIQRYAYKWKLISKQPLLPVEVMREYGNRLNWESICEFRILSEAMVDEFEAYIDWKIFCRYQPLTEEIVYKYYDRLPWSILIVRQNLSMNLIKDYWYFIEPYVDLAVKYQKFDPSYMSDKNLKYPETRMDRWSSKQKWERCRQFSYQGNIESKVVTHTKAPKRTGTLF